VTTNEQGDLEGTERAHIERDSASFPSFRIRVVDGPDRGKEATLGSSSPGPFYVGTGKTCDFVLTDPQVSRRHLALEAGPHLLRLVDQGSTNGTRIGSLEVSDVALSGGEVVRMGESSLQIEATSDATKLSLWPVESFGRLLGASVAMRRLYPLLQKLAASNLPVIVEGETGTGKELVAECLHEMGPRQNHPFIVFDGTAAHQKHAEAILFGEESVVGGRRVARKGVFEEANGGTLLLDEVAELPLLVQARLLRVLERGEISRVGGDGWIRVDVRVIATSRRDLDREIEAGRFREEVFFRLAGARVALPPLRQRKGDLAQLAHHFWRQIEPNRLLPLEFLSSFEGYAWPGNLRELQKVLARKAALGDLDPSSRSTDLISGGAGTGDEKAFERVIAQNLSFSEARARVLADFERVFVAHILARHGGNVSHAAAASGLARRYFQILKHRSG
jgi:two-component system response regulator HydG